MIGGMRVTEAVGAICVGHITVSLIGMGNSIVAKPPPPPPAIESDGAACASFSRAAQLTKVVAKLYSGGGLDAACAHEHITFTDPAAKCAGRAEVTEAFRALRAVNPQHVVAPVATAEDGGTVEFYLHQRYAAGSALLPAGFVVKSTCVVRTASDGRIASIEERWNGAPLLDYSAFRWVRRANGLVSAILTPIFT